MCTCPIYFVTCYSLLCLVFSLEYTMSVSTTPAIFMSGIMSMHVHVLTQMYLHVNVLYLYMYLYILKHVLLVFNFILC